MTLKPLVAFAFALLPSALAAPKPKPTLPDYVLTAHTVAVLIDPGAGVSLEDPRANQVAQKDVETALANWGRFATVIGSENADLLIVIRKGHRHLVEETVSDPCQNSRAGVINPTADGINLGAQHGRQPALSGASTQKQSGTGDAHSSTDIAPTQDTFLLFDGKPQRPLDNPPIWRLTASNALKPHTVPAVDELRKAVAEAEKSAANRKP